MFTADDNIVIELIAEIHGTDGQQFHPLMHDEEDGLWLFVPDLCRSLRAKYFGDEKVNGIDTKHYEAAEDLFDLKSAENLCYCHGVESCATEVEGEDSWDLSSCPQCSLGLMNSQGCQGAPAFGSSPHFHMAHPNLSQAVDGLSPDHEAHKTFLNIEPYSGVAFQAHKRIQVGQFVRDKVR